MSEHAAVWVPDGKAPVCMHCEKSQFTIINRRVKVWLIFSLIITDK